MINKISGNNNYLNLNKSMGLDKDKGFKDLLMDSINKINSYNEKAERDIVSFIKGGENEVHNLMISMEEAKLTLQMAVEIRNKFVEAYQELSKIQI